MAIYCIEYKYKDLPTHLMLIRALKKAREQWYEINKPLGLKLGFPECCVNSFCDMPPALLRIIKPTKDFQDRCKAGHINGRFTGFIPCSCHAKQILKGEITLASLVKNRSAEFPPFPTYAQ